MLRRLLNSYNDINNKDVWATLPTIFFGKPKRETDEKIYVQAAYILADEAVAEREFGAYRVIQDNYPKYVISMDKIHSSRDGMIHMNVINFCLKGI